MGLPNILWVPCIGRKRTRSTEGEVRMSTTTENTQRLLQSFVPSSSLRAKVSVSAASTTDAPALGIAAYSSGQVSGALSLPRERLAAAGFTGGAGKALVVATAKGPVIIAAGMGAPEELTADRIRD